MYWYPIGRYLKSYLIWFGYKLVGSDLNLGQNLSQKPIESSAILEFEFPAFLNVKNKFVVVLNQHDSAIRRFLDIAKLQIFPVHNLTKNLSPRYLLKVVEIIYKQRRSNEVLFKDFIQIFFPRYENVFFTYNFVIYLKKK